MSSHRLDTGGGTPLDGGVSRDGALPGARWLELDGLATALPLLPSNP
jgi:hypothetical protein